MKNTNRKRVIKRVNLILITLISISCNASISAGSEAKESPFAKLEDKPDVLFDFESIEGIANDQARGAYKPEDGSAYKPRNDYYLNIPAQYPPKKVLLTNQGYYPHTFKIMKAGEGDAPASAISGDQLLRVELRPDDPNPNGIYRAEVRTNPRGTVLSTQKTNYIEWYLYFPEDFNPGPVKGNLILSQINGNGAQNGKGGPQVTISLQDPEDGAPYFWNVSVRKDKDTAVRKAGMENATIGGERNFKFDQAGQWVKFNLIYKYSQEGNGIVRVWMNDTLIGEKIGNVGHDPDRNPYFKCGIYHCGTYPVVTFIDNIKIFQKD